MTCDTADGLGHGKESLNMSFIPHDAGLLLTCVLIAFFGGGIRAALSGPDQPFRAVAVYSAACGFTGLVVSLSLLYLGVIQPYLLLLLAALAGWIGPNVIDLVANIATARVGARVGSPIIGGQPQPTMPAPVEIHVHAGTPMQQPSAFLQATNPPVLPAQEKTP